MSTNDEPFDESLLTAYLDNELSPQQKREVEQTIDQSPHLQQLLAELTRIRSLVLKCKIEVPALSRNLHHADWNPNPSPKIHSRTIPRTAIGLLAALAASILVVASIAPWANHRVSKKSEESANVIREMDSDPQPSETEMETKNGPTSLGDGEKDFESRMDPASSAAKVDQSGITSFRGSGTVVLPPGAGMPPQSSSAPNENFPPANVMERLPKPGKAGTSLKTQSTSQRGRSGKEIHDVDSFIQFLNLELNSQRTASQDLVEQSKGLERSETLSFKLGSKKDELDRFNIREFSESDPTQESQTATQYYLVDAIEKFPGPGGNPTELGAAQLQQVTNDLALSARNRKTSADDLHAVDVMIPVEYWSEFTATLERFQDVTSGTDRPELKLAEIKEPSQDDVPKRTAESVLGNDSFIVSPVENGWRIEPVTTEALRSVAVDNLRGNPIPKENAKREAVEGVLNHRGAATATTAENPRDSKEDVAQEKKKAFRRARFLFKPPAVPDGRNE